MYVCMYAGHSFISIQVDAAESKRVTTYLPTYLPTGFFCHTYIHTYILISSSPFFGGGEVGNE